jgi:taurine dioxygenase
MEITPLTGTLGAEVSGVDMAHVDDTTRDDLRKAWLDHKVLVLRDQHVTTGEHVAFGRLFGELEEHPFTDGIDAHPEIVVLHATNENRFVASGWHSDVTWREEPSMGSILRGVIIPPVGGDTCFADATAAYDRLSDEWKERVDDLFAIHDYMRVFGGLVPEEEKEATRAKYPPARHPVIRTHPETGARGIYTNIGFTSHIEGVDAEESERILRHLREAIANPSVQCRIRWDVDTFVMWDNRCTQHCATTDFFPHERRMERVTVIGDRPF